MSTTTYPSAVATAPRTRLRITGRGRRVIAGLVAFPLATAVIASVLSGALLDGGTAAASSSASSKAVFDTVTVMPGDTLWLIAHQVAPHDDPRDVVDEIIRLNLLNPGALPIGQELAIPAKYSAE